MTSMTTFTPNQNPFNFVVSQTQSQYQGFSINLSDLLSNSV